MKARLGQAILAGILWVTFGLHGSAQVTTATFYGIVTDSSSAVLPGASVAMTHQGTGAVNEQLSDERGEFAFTFVSAGTYTLKIEMPGFRAYVAEGLQLGAAQNIRRTFVLEVGGLTDQVTVTSESPMLNTVAPEQREAYSQLQIKELPLARRNFTGLLTQGTGVTKGSGGNVRLNGVGRNGTRITVDGAESTANPEASGTTMFGNFNYIDVMSIEAIGEVQTTKGIVAAEYASVLAGNVNVSTRSGTNEWHGSVFENYTGAALNARVQTADSKPSLTFNQFGGSMGGPIKKDRAFFFGAYEGYREAAGQVVQGNVPTQRLRNAMLAAVPDYKLWLDFMPLPNQPHDPNGQIGRILRVGTRRSTENQLVVKFDILLVGNSNLAVSYIHGRPYRLTPHISELNPLQHVGSSERVAVSYVFGRPSWSAETRFGYNYANVERFDGYSLLIDPKNSNEIGALGRRVPEISGLSFNGVGAEYIEVGGPSWSIEEKLSKIVGRHAIKLGGIYSARLGGGTNVENPETQYANETDLLANIPNNVRVTWGTAPFKSLVYEFGFFIQDDWRISPKLTLNMGFRYDYFSPYVATPKNPNQPAGLFNFDGLLDPYNFVFGPLRDPKSPVEADPLNLGPRLGFAYNPDGRAKNVVRGGLGVMFTSLSPSIFRNAVGATPNLPYRRDYSRTEATRFGLRFPTYNDDTKSLILAENKTFVTDAFDPTFERPYLMSGYLGFQRELSSSMMLETAFVGNRGVKFLVTRFFNQIDRATGRRPNEALGFEGQYQDPSQQTFYASWQSSLRKRLSDRWAWNMHHTWGKSLSYTGGDTGSFFTNDTTRTAIQDFNDIRINRSPSTGDKTHVVATDWIYELPTFAGWGPALQQVLGGWQLTGIVRAETGPAFNVTQLSTGGPPSRPDIIDFKNAVLKDYRKTGQYLNAAAFALVPVSPVSRVPIRPGNAGHNALRGPGELNVDLSLGKNFTLREALRLQLRMDMFNAFNHTNYLIPVASINSPDFGRLLTTAGARTIQFHGRMSF